MRAAFLISPELKLVSSVVPKLAADFLTVGYMALMVKSFDTPYGRISAGTKGFVDFIDFDTGAVWLLMEGMEPALAMWDNMLVLMPFDTDDLTECFAFVPRDYVYAPGNPGRRLRHKSRSVQSEQLQTVEG